MILAEKADATLDKAVKPVKSSERKPADKEQNNAHPPYKNGKNGIEYPYSILFDFFTWFPV